MVGERSSLNAEQIKQGVPLRSLASWNNVVLHPCREGDVLHSEWVCHEKPWLLLFLNECA